MTEAGLEIMRQVDSGNRMLRGFKSVGSVLGCAGTNVCMKYIHSTVQGNALTASPGILCYT